LIIAIISQAKIASNSMGQREFIGCHLVMGYYMSFCSWLGVTSQTQWEYLMEEDVEPTCEAVINFCERFFEVAPKLLKGLEFEKITPD
jgi:hypothetical protein